MVAGLVVTLVSTLARPITAAAHPLGNFTVNRYSRIEVSPGRVRVRYVMDVAEIPTFQAINRPPDGAPPLDANGDGAVSEAERHSYAERQAVDISRNLDLSINGSRVLLRAQSADAELLPGQGGLQTLRFTAWLAPEGAGAALEPLARDRAATVTYRDANDPWRIGWREIVVRPEDLLVTAADGTALSERDVSDELRRYPEDLLQLPLDVRAVSFTAVPPAAVHNRPSAQLRSAPEVPTSSHARAFLLTPDWVVQAARGTQVSIERARGGVADLVTSSALTPAVVLAALLAAMAAGAVHALSPGHGKTIVGAYLVGARGTTKHALFLWATVTLVHTAGVYALLFVTLFAARYLLPEQLFPWMSLASGLLVLGIGASMLRSRVRGLINGRGVHGHDHAVPTGDRAPVSWRSLLALGISGGLLPCPSAMVIGLGAIALQRVLYGLVLILAFSIGLAGALMGIGLAAVWSGRAVSGLQLAKRIGRNAGLNTLLRAAPLGSASVIALAGLALSVEALAQLDPSTLRRLPELYVTAVQVAHAAQGGLAEPLQGGTLVLLSTALTLGLRHGIDWDHLAAIGDITSSTQAAGGRRSQRSDQSGPHTSGPGWLHSIRAAAPAIWLASHYAVGHATVVVVLGIAALSFRAVLPEWVDTLMERVVGATLVALGCYVAYGLMRVWRTGDSFRIQSRWMLAFAGLRSAWRHIAFKVHGHPHNGQFHVHRVDAYGPASAFGTGVIHGIGAETGTQVLLIAAVGGAASQGLGTAMLLAFVAGLLCSNTATAVLASLGVLSVTRARGLYLLVGCVAAVFSFYVGIHGLLGVSDHLPSLQHLLGTTDAEGRPIL